MPMPQSRPYAPSVVAARRGLDHGVATQDGVGFSYRILDCHALSGLAMTVRWGAAMTIGG